MRHVLGGAVANFDFRGKIRTSGIRNSMAYRLQNSRKSKFATEPLCDLFQARDEEQLPGVVDRWESYGIAAQVVHIPPTGRS
jgi:hypothetical protein